VKEPIYRQEKREIQRKGDPTEKSGKGYLLTKGNNPLSPLVKKGTTKGIFKVEKYVDQKKMKRTVRRTTITRDIKQKTSPSPSRL